MEHKKEIPTLSDEKNDPIPEELQLPTVYRIRQWATTPDQSVVIVAYNGKRVNERQLPTVVSSSRIFLGFRGPDLPVKNFYLSTVATAVLANSVRFEDLPSDAVCTTWYGGPSVAGIPDWALRLSPSVEVVPVRNEIAVGQTAGRLRAILASYTGTVRVLIAGSEEERQAAQVLVVPVETLYLTFSVPPVSPCPRPDHAAPLRLSDLPSDAILTQWNGDTNPWMWKKLWNPVMVTCSNEWPQQASPSDDSAIWRKIQTFPPNVPLSVTDERLVRALKNYLEQHGYSDDPRLLDMQAGLVAQLPSGTTCTFTPAASNVGRWAAAFADNPCTRVLGRLRITSWERITLPEAAWRRLSVRTHVAVESNDPRTVVRGDTMVFAAVHPQRNDKDRSVQVYVRHGVERFLLVVQRQDASAVQLVPWSTSPWSYGHRQGIETWVDPQTQEETHRIPWVTPPSRKRGERRWSRRDGIEVRTTCALRTETTWRAGKKQGPYRVVHALTGQWLTEGAYEQDERHGRWVQWWGNGNIACTGWFVRGKRHGRCTHYERTGATQRTQEYVAGMPVRTGAY